MADDGRPLRMYMGYDAVPGGGACLVFAHTAREARKLAWPILSDWYGTDFIGARAKWLRDDEFGYLRDSARSDQPHAIAYPPFCDSCERWGVGVLDAGGLCADCRQEADDDG